MWVCRVAWNKHGICVSCNSGEKFLGSKKIGCCTTTSWHAAKSLKFVKKVKKIEKLETLINYFYSFLVHIMLHKRDLNTYISIIIEKVLITTYNIIKKILFNVQKFYLL